MQYCAKVLSDGSVYVNSKKFACESCIKGHRSSSCHHTDRPLFEIKKKGRPISQCEKCRELRQSKRVHSKCCCNPKEDPPPKGQALPSSSTTKPKRFIPIVPALPNGLKDVLRASQMSSSVPADSRQRVDSLLNPCNCRSVWKCKCRASNPDSSVVESCREQGLVTLARAAAMRCSTEAPSPSSASSYDSPGKHSEKTKRHNSRSGSPNHFLHKRPKLTSSAPSPGPELPPILLPSPSHSMPIPTFATMPPMSAITSLAGTGCTCGLRCACPGCVEHRGTTHVVGDRTDCAEGCGTCVDHASGIALPGHTENNSTISILDQFFARAAALPAPPTNRKMGTGLHFDPMNIMVYPETARETEQRGAAFGLVSLPKLECCGGRCGCPNGRCGCGKTCDGCCADHDGGKTIESEIDRLANQQLPLTKDTLPPVSPVLQSCCAGKIAVNV